MRQMIPKSFDKRLSFTDAVIHGLQVLGALLKVVHNPEALMRQMALAVRTANAEYQAAVAATKAAFAAKQATAKEVVAFITRAREVLKSILGQRYSVGWREAGFLTPTLRVPRVFEVQQNLLTSLAAYFTSHPETEVKDWGVTAARAKELYAAAAAHSAAVCAACAVQREKKTVRDESFQGLESQLRSLYQELRQLLKRNDPRWLEFGFNVPEDKPTPAAPEGVTVTPGQTGEASLSWIAPVNTERFHIWQEVVGVDAAPVRVATVTATSHALKGLAPGAHMKFFITAVNGAGESPPSDVVELVVP